MTSLPVVVVKKEKSQWTTAPVTHLSPPPHQPCTAMPITHMWTLLQSTCWLYNWTQCTHSLSVHNLLSWWTGVAIEPACCVPVRSMLLYCLGHLDVPVLPWSTTQCKVRWLLINTCKVYSACCDSASGFFCSHPWQPWPHSDFITMTS